MLSKHFFSNQIQRKTKQFVLVDSQVQNFVAIGATRAAFVGRLHTLQPFKAPKLPDPYVQSGRLRLGRRQLVECLTHRKPPGASGDGHICLLTGVEGHLLSSFLAFSYVFSSFDLVCL